MRMRRRSEEQENHQEYKKGLWTVEEDNILTDYVQIHGTGQWNRIVRKTGLKRCGKSCRLRWINYLSPSVNKSNFTEQEEDLIIRLHKLLGNRWSLIAKRVPGRTDNQVKNHWNTHLSKKFVGDYSSAVKTTGDDTSPVPLLISAAAASSRQHQQDKIFDSLVPASYENKPNADLTRNDVVVGSTNDPSLYFRDKNNLDSSNAFLFNEDDEFELMSSLAMMDFASSDDIGYYL
ncbi:hypothetical protein N665_1159s0021 [Sinapis alba]|nr:hypothetical protein N665_1159s0021 [Sinapis alba]